MLKLFLYVYVLSALVFALPLESAKTKATPDQEVRIVRNEYEDFGDGAYRFYYETSDGQKREERADVIEIEGEEPYTTVTGFYSYIGPDGVEYKVEYTADQNGFVADGAHLPRNIDDLSTTDEPVGLPANAINSLLG